MQSVKQGCADGPAGSNGVQIVPPHDAGIAQAIESNLEVPEEAWTPEELLQTSDLCIENTEKLKEAYIETLASLNQAESAEFCTLLSTHADIPLDSSVNSGRSNFQAVYTPMHGVGYPFAASVMSAFQFSASALQVVPSQQHPDPNFPSVKFPNPEEKGALDAAVAFANERGISLVLANDPDADRFSAAEKSKSVKPRSSTKGAEEPVQRHLEAVYRRSDRSDARRLAVPAIQGCRQTFERVVMALYR